MNQEQSDTNIPKIDESLANIYTRLCDVQRHLDCAVYGERPIAKDSAKIELASPSLSSIFQREQNVHGVIGDIEALVNRLHA